MPELHACTGENISPYPLVLLHGWGFDSRIWIDILPLLQQHFDVVTVDLPCFGTNTFCTSSLELVMEHLIDRLPEKCILLGWSLGGMLATCLAIHFPSRIHALITVGSNLKWVGDNAWPGASADNFAAFFDNLVRNFEGAQQHFCSVVARGDIKEKWLVRILRAKLDQVPQENFLKGLHLLASIDNRSAFSFLRVPGLHVFGEKDAMVPLTVAKSMSQLNQQQHIAVMDGAAHAPFLSRPEFFIEILKTFTYSTGYHIDKKHIAKSFSKAATTYDAAAQLQCDIGNQLFSFLPMITPDNVLDLGCGTGFYSRQLQQRFTAARIISLDMAAGMLQVAQSQSQTSCGVCADAETLPFKQNSLDLVFSNLMMQWCQHPLELFVEVHRVLKPGAYALLSTFTEGTLHELSVAWKTVDKSIHVNQFFSVEFLQATVKQAGFSDVAFTTIKVSRDYDSVGELLRELKAVGAHNLNRGRSPGLTGKRKLQRLVQAYETFRQQTKLPATYQVTFLVLKK